MTCISSNQDYISIVSENKTFLIKIDNSKLFCVDHKSIKTSVELIEEPSKSKVVEAEEFGIGLLCCDFSPKGNIFAFCTLSKALCVLDISLGEISSIKVFELVRGASRVKFTTSGRYIVAADKTGDVYLFDLLQKNDVKGKLILGHLSMLLDVIVTSDEKYIITCDRDEKIRVSSFPNGYNIISYCLGHSEFVSSIHLLPHNDNYLFSTSGDSTVRFWNYIVGKEIMIFDTLSHLTSRTENGQAVSYTEAIIDAAAIYADKFSSLICLALENVKNFFIVKCTSNSETNNIECFLSQCISLQESSPLRFTFTCNCLWLILNCQGKLILKAIKFHSDSGEFDNDIPEQAEKVLNIFSNLKLKYDCKQNVVSLLYKRKFDNVQDYLAKKELRINNLEHFSKKAKLEQVIRPNRNCKDQIH